MDTLKTQIIQIAALTDRGQRHNKLVSNAYTAEENHMKTLVNELVEYPCSIDEAALEGEWELVYASCELFRSSPFFLAIEKALKNEARSSLFFKLHLLQVGSWGASTVGRVAQRLDFKSSQMESEFDTILFGLTVIPVLGWFKLLPTFGGTVVTVAKDLKLEGDAISMELLKTQVVETEGVAPGLLGKLLMNRWAPVNTVWKILPWNWGTPPTCSMTIKYVDANMRVMEDMYGQIFVYTRPMLM
ncbi:hypothetical protein CYMTET_18829 [Cymbomonas tetramitiformis]|uniref:Plastid lipid-associated protein/fibrillin conserved domain-containing protein n=1 Tax=Cymbomonas tetramitiformis TaxID=36881 RepID=A0AAE0G7A7_9CHLO|nr:hypothetical protein CYMTET_18829 [Cymbomonas tetramitiformis]|eukprot:gene7333-8730_t